MKKVLVPTDFSSESKNAFDLAVDFCNKTGAALHLLNVADLPVASDPMGTNLHSYFSPDLIKQLEDTLKEKLNAMTSEVEGVRIEGEIVWGNPFGGISKYITENDVDLVIMGTRGASGVRELFVGSNTEKVVRHAESPVIAVKEPIRLDEIKNIVFGNELESDQEELVQRVKELQNIVGAELHVVRVNTPARFKRDAEIWHELESFASKYSLENYTLNIFNEYHEDQGLIYFAEKIGADMIALGTHGRSGLRHLYSGSIAEDIVNHAKRPIWTYIIR